MTIYYRASGDSGAEKVFVSTEDLKAVSNKITGNQAEIREKYVKATAEERLKDAREIVKAEKEELDKVGVGGRKYSPSKSELSKMGVTELKKYKGQLKASQEGLNYFFAQGRNCSPAATGIIDKELKYIEKTLADVETMIGKARIRQALINFRNWLTNIGNATNTKELKEVETAIHKDLAILSMIENKKEEDLPKGLSAFTTADKESVLAEIETKRKSLIDQERNGRTLVHLDTDEDEKAEIRANEELKQKRTLDSLTQFIKFDAGKGELDLISAVNRQGRQAIAEYDKMEKADRPDKAQFKEALQEAITDEFNRTTNYSKDRAVLHILYGVLDEIFK